MTIREITIEGDHGQATLTRTGQRISVQLVYGEPNDLEPMGRAQTMSIHVTDPNLESWISMATGIFYRIHGRLAGEGRETLMVLERLHRLAWASDSPDREHPELVHIRRVAKQQAQTWAVGVHVHLEGNHSPTLTEHHVVAVDAEAAKAEAERRILEAGDPEITHAQAISCYQVAHN